MCVKSLPEISCGGLLEVTGKYNNRTKIEVERFR